MGLYNGVEVDYYSGFEQFGAYQFITIKDIINNFRVAYVGEDKIISKISRADIKFHAMRGIQELTYDTFRSCKTLKLEIPPCLTFPIPHDYVNYVKLTWLDADGVEHVIYPARHATSQKEKRKLKKDRKESNTNPRARNEGDGPTDTADCIREFGQEYYWDGKDCVKDDHGSGSGSGCGDGGDCLGCTDPEAVNWNKNCKGEDVGTATIDDGCCYYNEKPIEEDCDMKIGVPSSTPNGMGAGYGIDPQYTQSNGWFFINCKDGHIHFSSNIVGKTVVLEYISDGLGTDGEMIVHKMAEEAMYKHIAHAILNTRANTDPNLVARFKKERFAAIRNAKIRLSNIKLEEITQVLRGKSKWIKH
tara:strand:- start:620 stop:1699 length:1080 start_codon:yes stop_codon:yes gene_type:complete